MAAIFEENTEMLAQPVKGVPYFDRKAPANYDGNGKTETFQQEVQGLYERLINKGFFDAQH